MKQIVALGKVGETPNKVVGVSVDCPLVDVTYRDGNKKVTRTYRDVTDYFSNSESIKVAMIKVKEF